MSFLGKLGPDSIPHDPIVLVTVALMVLGGIAAVAGITYFKNGTTCGLNGSHL